MDSVYRDWLVEDRTLYLGSKGKTSWITNRQGLKLACYFWPAQTAPKGVVVLIHGHGSYVCYEFLKLQAPGLPLLYKDSWVERLNQQGYSVCGVDNQGTGRSEGLRGYIDKFSDLVDDVLQFVSATSVIGPEGFTGLPRFLLGVSLGGHIAVRCIWQQPELFHGVVLLSPMLSLEKLSKKGLNPYLRPVASLLSWLAPTLPLIETSKNLMFPHLQAAWDADCIVYRGKTRCRTGAEYLSACESLGRHMDKFSFPFLIFHSENDTMTDPDGSKMMYKKAKGQHKALRLVNHMWHVLVKEDEDFALFSEILGWLEQRTASA